MKGVLRKIFRRKSSELVTSDTNLRRCLGVIDLMVIGLGGIIGSGIYVMTGITAKEQAGPSILISFVLASVIVLLIAACFTELAARLHKTGSTYLYLYLTVGELPAAVLGYSFLLSSVVGGAIEAQAWSSYADFLFSSAISNFTKTHVGNWTVGPPLASHPNFVAVAVVIVLTTVVALGVKCYARFSSIFVVINILVLCFMTVCGIILGHVSNWTAAQMDGSGSGFMPFGWAGVITGAASCFWAFSGFELISCAVEESHSPQRHIPIATLLTMLIVTTLYIGTAAGMTLLIPCQLLDTGAPLPSAVAHAGLTWGRYVVVIGPLCGFTTTLMSTTFGFVRISLAMAEDGLLWSWFADVNKCTYVPILPVVVCGLLQSIIACFCDIRDLISFSVNILLLSYCCACVAVIVLRYSNIVTQQLPADDKAATDGAVILCVDVHRHTTGDGEEAADELSSTDALFESAKDANNSASTASEGPTFNTALVDGKDTDDMEFVNNIFEDLPESSSDRLLSDDTYSAAATSLLPRCGCLESFVMCRSHICVNAALAMMLTFMLGLAFILIYGIVPLEMGQWWSIIVVAVTSCGVAFCLFIICIHRQTLRTAVLTLPCVPLIPSIAIFACLTLLVANSTKVGWIGCLVLLVLAMIFYFTYGIHHSKLNGSGIRYIQLDEATTALLQQQDDVDDEDKSSL